MKTNKRILIAALVVMIFTAQSCVTRNPACVRAHKNIKKLHLDSWI